MVIHLCLDELRVGSQALATRSSDNVNEASIVLNPLLCAATGLDDLALLLLDLRGLVSDLAGTRQRTVHLATTTKAEYQVQG